MLPIFKLSVMKKRPVEVLAEKYAEIFVSLFDRIEGSPQDPFIFPSPCPHQNMSGRIYSGGNALITSLVAAQKGYDIPVWMTISQINEAGLNVLKGERSTPIAFYNFRVLERDTHKDSGKTREEYMRMPPEERNQYELRCTLKWYNVFNIHQTNFESEYPEKCAELRARISGVPSDSIREELVDRLVEKDEWICPIRVFDNCLVPDYNRDRHRIVSPPMEAFVTSSSRMQK